MSILNTIGQPRSRFMQAKSAAWARRGMSRTVIVIAVVVIIIVAGIAVYAAGLTGGGSTTSSTTSHTSTSTGSGTSSTSTTTTTTPTTTTTSIAQNSLVVEEGLQPDSLDPAVTFQTPGWEVVDQVYQGLLTFNGTSSTSYLPELASNWTMSASGLNYTFSLRHGVTFSNGDPFNAYVQWYSIYRTLVMNQAPAFILSQNLATVSVPAINVTAAVLNSIDYRSPSPANLTYMETPGQSVQVIDQYTIRFNLGWGYNGMAPYNAFLQTLTTPMAMAVDPVVVMANGGVSDGQPNTWMETHAVGTGFYNLQSWVQGQSVKLVKSTSYWASSLPTTELNDAIRPAIIGSVIIYYKTESARIADLQGGTAQIIDAPVTDQNSLKSISGVAVNKLPISFGSAANTYYVYMDPVAFPAFNNTLVREAVAHAIDYNALLHSVVGGQGVQWIGPVPAGFPLYNESISGLSPYAYNPTAAAQELAAAGYQATLPNGTKLNPSGQVFPSTNFLYNPDSTTQKLAAQVIQGELASIGMNLNLAPLATSQWFNVVDLPGDTNTTYPIGINFYTEDYTASIDYVTALTTNYLVGTSAYYNNTVVGWQTNAATSSDPATVTQAFQNITRAMYNSYTDIWLFVPYQLTVNQSNLAGMIPNPAGSGAGYFLFYNTVRYTAG